jgi:predicted PurR-regulated permease PerM
MTVNERSNESPEGVITGAVEAVRDRPAFLRVMLVLAATVVGLVGMRLAAPVMDSLLFAAVSSPLVSLDYSWLKRCGIPTVE